MIEITEPGVYPGIPEQEYHADSETRESTTPSHYQHVPCEQAEDDGCPNDAAFRAAHIVCGWGPLFCPSCTAKWRTQLATYPFTFMMPTCKWCGARVMGPDEMEARPL